MTVEKTGLIYTNENCTGCNRCISVCLVLTANNAVEIEGKPVIEVNADNCIACGACFDACEHNARSFNDDTEVFFQDLKKVKRFRCYWHRPLQQIILMDIKEF